MAEQIITAVEYDYYARKKAIDRLCGEYGFIKKRVIGRSCAGREITALTIGSASEYCLYAAAFHGSERISATVLLLFLEELCRGIRYDGCIEGLKVQRAMLGRGVIFVPCVNPDGCEIALYGKKACGSHSGTVGRLCRNDFEHWNANLRGVDINHNFNAGWKELRKMEQESGIYGPGPTRYGGTKPESEPETLALTELCRSIRIRHCVAFHTQGEVIYWNYGKSQPPRAKKMAEIMATSSGYALDAPIGLAVGGGFKDWFIHEFNRPGFTVELGKGENPLPAESAYDIYRTVREMLMLCAIM